MKYLITTLLLIFSGTFCYGAVLDGKTLAEAAIHYDKMSENPDATPNFHAGLFLGYVGGLADELFPNSGIPKDVSIKQINKIFSKFLKNNPKKWHRSGNVLFRMSIKEAFPEAKL
jgi:hypothetical protein